MVNPFALRKAKIIYNLAFLSAKGLSKIRRVPKYLREQRNSREKNEMRNFAFGSSSPTLPVFAVKLLHLSHL